MGTKRYVIRFMRNGIEYWTCLSEVSEENAVSVFKKWNKDAEVLRVKESEEYGEELSV